MHFKFLFVYLFAFFSAADDQTHLNKIAEAIGRAGGYTPVVPVLENCANNADCTKEQPDGNSITAIHSNRMITSLVDFILLGNKFVYGVFVLRDDLHQTV